MRARWVVGRRDSLGSLWFLAVNGDGGLLWVKNQMDAARFDSKRAAKRAALKAQGISVEELLSPEVV